MIESEAMESDIFPEVERLKHAVEFLKTGLLRVKSRPAEESAFLAVTFLQEAKNRFGVSYE